ncbi:MAG: HAD-IIIC family phosphatase [Lachnospiraceae bacterium]|nr:HAD-IIIC family phosphatase [Lachnospiraceae bacterium]
MKTYNELKKNIKKFRDTPEKERISLAVLGDSATQFLANAIRGMGYEHQIRAEVYDAEYDSIETSIFDEASELYQEERDFVVLYFSVERAYEEYQRTPENTRQDFAEQYLDRILSCWDGLKRNTRAVILQFNFNRMDEGVLGNYALREPSSFSYQLFKLNYLLAEKASQAQSVFLIDLDMIQAEYGKREFSDRKYYYQARMSLGFEAVVRSTEEIYDVIFAVRGRIRKCLILDLDNTLWGGIVGEDGLNGIEIGELGAGRAFSDLQRWCLELKKRGILLAVCSKNDEDQAKEPFEKHPDMILHLDDFAVFVANWEDKASNIRWIQSVLNIGFDSMVFLDDNPYERNLVRELIPEVTVPELPEDPAEYLSFLQPLHLFETASFALKGADRTGLYHAEAKRREAESASVSIEEYLQSLEMTAEAKPFDAFHYPRIAELSQRSNQFNLRTVRYLEDEIRHLAEDEGYLTRYFMLRDRFGDYGLISAVILKKLEGGRAFIDTWFMSCRVLKRGMEEYIMNEIVSLCRKEGIGQIIGEYLRTSKNDMVSGLYDRLGFTNEGEGRYLLEVKDYRPFPTFIH